MRDTTTVTSREAPTFQRDLPSETPSSIERIRNHELPVELSGLIESYDAVVGDRDVFLWKWAHYLFPRFTLSCVPAERVERLRHDKLVGLMFVSVLDDVAEKHGDRATFEEAAKVPFDHLSVDYGRRGVDESVVTFASELWDHLSPELQAGPRTAEFEDIFRFDLKQVFNAIDFSFVANQDIGLVNGSDLRTYEAHNMMLYVFADVDIAHSPTFDRSELSTLRRVIERAQRMVRIGNWVTTWQRELAEADFTSGIVVYALEHDIVTDDDLAALRERGEPDEIATVADRIRSHDVEEVFLARWLEELREARDLQSDVESVDVEGYLDGIETVMDYHLASRGLK